MVLGLVQLRLFGEVVRGGAGAAAGPSGAAAPGPGLSYAHIRTCEGVKPCPGEFKLKVPENGGCVRVTEVGFPRPHGGRLGVRGQVKGFSRGSRLRMLELVQSINREAVGSIFFVTLTVPRGERDFKGIERDRDLWCRRFNRQWGSDAAFIIWKKEPHKSGTPHVHALVFWVKPAPRMKDFREWNDNAWADVVKSSNEFHRKIGCRVEGMRKWEGVASYAAKYLGKDQECSLGETGRMWGVHNRSVLAVSVREEVVSAEVGKRVRRALRKLQEKKKSHWVKEEVRPDGSKYWRRVRPVSVAADAGGCGKQFIYLSVEEQLASCRRRGVRVRFVKGRALSTRVVPVWADTEEQGMFSTKTVKRVELVGQEIWSFASGLHFVRSADVGRLVAFFKRRCAADAVEEALLPF